MKLEYVRSILFDPSNDSIIYAVGKNDNYHISDGGVFLSMHKGETWSIGLFRVLNLVFSENYYIFNIQLI